MSRTHRHNRNDRKRSLRSIFPSVANLHVLLSLLFVVQFVPVEHLSCLFGHDAMPSMTHHGAMAEGLSIVGAGEAGSMACCKGLSAVRAHRHSAGLKPCCSLDRQEQAPVLLKHDTEAVAVETVQPPGLQIRGCRPSGTGPPLIVDYGPSNLHLLNSAFLI